MKYSLGIVVALFVAIGGWYFLSANSTADQTNSEDGLSVVTSFYPLQFALEEILGERGTVVNVGEGRDPHDFEPSTQDMVTMQRADLVVLQGADFEPWGDDVKARLEADNVPVVIATANLELHEGGHEHDEHEDDHSEEIKEEVDNHDQEDKDHAHDEEHEDENHAHDEEHEDDHSHDEDHSDEHEDDDGHSHGAYDPHTWLSPVMFSQMIDSLTAEIIAVDRDNAEMYEANASALKTELELLHSEYTERLANCSLSEVITSHDAFGYVGDEYDFEIHAIAGLSTQDTPSIATLAELREEAEEGIGAILLEENSITAYGETLSRETGLQTLSINPIAYIIPEGADYFSLMRDNLDTFATALSCND